VLHGTVTLGLVVALGAGAVVCRADIFAYTDQSGVTHFTDHPDNSRYKLILHTPPPSSEAAGAQSADARRASAWLARSVDYDASIARAAAEAKVRPELVRAVIVVESGFNPRAVSRRGAVGLMQLLPTTARRYGAFNAFDPEQNIQAGTHYLADLIARYGGEKLELVLAAYNAGEDAVERYRGIPPYRETIEYVRRIQRILQR
jgi:soluble lytic murein transglycosylase-like protein